MPPRSLLSVPFAGALMRTLVLAVLLSLVLVVPANAQREVVEAGICEIQGSSWESPLTDKLVMTHGIVTSDLLDTERFGFFLEDPDCDDDPATSNGVWVYVPKGVETPPDLAEGRCVIVTAEVNEYFGFTELVLQPEGVAVEGECEVPPPFPLDPPQDTADSAVYLEAREGMYVGMPPSVVVGSTNQYGDSYVVPQSAGIGRVFRTALDGRKVGMQSAGWWLAVNHADKVSGIVGGLSYNYENYKVLMSRRVDLQTEPGEIDRPQTAPPAAPDELSIATYNVENLFDPVDNPDKEDEDSTPTPEMYEKMLGVRACSIVSGLRAPDIIGLQEVENERVLVDLAAAIQKLTATSADPDIAGATYVGTLVEGPDGRGIDVAWLYRSDRIRLLSNEQRNICSTVKQAYELPECEMPGGGKGMLLYGRPPLIGRFEVIATGGRINLIVNHFKSKGGGDAITTPIRTAMASHNREMILELKGAEPDVPAFVLGDLNDFEDSEPITTLTADDVQVDLWGSLAPEEHYSFIYNGVSQILDYILVEKDTVATFLAIHTNSDTGSTHENDIRGTCLPGEAHERASDHEPLLVRLPYSELPLPGTRITKIYMPALLKSAWIVGEPPTEEPPATATGSDPVPTDVPTDPPATAGTEEPPGPTNTSVPPPLTDVPTALPTKTATVTATPGLPPSPTASAGQPPRMPLRIDTVFYDGENGRNEPDEYVVFTNSSGAAVNLTGWELISVRGDQRYTFPSGASIDSQQTCRVYTNEVHEQYCGLSMGLEQAIWRNSGDKAELRDPSGKLIDWFCYGDYEGECG